MLNVSYFTNSNEIFESSISENTLVVCPSPTIADSFRIFTKNKLEVITIAKWISDIKLTKNQKRVGKAELMLRLASAWRQYFPNSSENIFYNSFEIFTEIRSFSLDLNVVQSILFELDEEISKSIKIFWAVLEADCLVDEHLAYFLKKEIKSSRPLLFIGFKHLSAIQIDMVKKISESIDVHFFIPYEVKSASISTDWVNWIDTKSFKNNSSKTTKELNIVIYPSKKLNNYLKSLPKIEDYNISFVGSSIGFLQTQEVVINDITFKDQVDLFKSEKINTFEKLHKLNISNVFLLKDEIENCKKLSIEKQEFKEYKVWSLIQEALTIYQDYSEHFDEFVFGLIKEVVELDTPRNFYIPILKNINKQLVNFEEIKYNLELGLCALVLSKEGSPFNARENKYADNLIDVLKQLGPIKRGGLDILFSKNNLLEVLNKGQCVFFVEDGLIETDSTVREVLESFKLNYVNLNVNIANKTFEDILGKKLNANFEKTPRLSASRLQTYFDCPRKYLLNYLEKIDDTPLDKIGIAADEKGNLEHKIIGTYFQKYPSLDSTKLLEISQLVLNEYLELNKKEVNFQDYNESLYELVEYTQNGLMYLFELKRDRPNCKILFEVPLISNDLNVNGFIDCLIEDDDQFEIYDFKRSALSVGSKEELIKFEKLQLWIYAIVMNNKKKVTKISYVNLSEQNKVSSVEVGLNLNDFNVYLNEFLKKFRSEIAFWPAPRKDSVCEFCIAKKICVKEFAHG